MDLVMQVYDASAAFPSDERYCLSEQLRRAAISIASNIAEGHGRGHRGDYVRFLAIARGSVREVHTLLEIAHRRRYLSQSDMDDLRALQDHVGGMLTRMILTLSRRSTS